MHKKGEFSQITSIICNFPIKPQMARLKSIKGKILARLTVSNKIDYS